jgi:hypothetical protein
MMISEGGFTSFWLINQPSLFFLLDENGMCFPSFQKIFGLFLGGSKGCRDGD